MADTRSIPLFDAPLAAPDAAATHVAASVQYAYGEYVLHVSPYRMDGEVRCYPLSRMRGQRLHTSPRFRSATLASLAADPAVLAAARELAGL
jgi:hypothetical protein